MEVPSSNSTPEKSPVNVEKKRFTVKRCKVCKEYAACYGNNAACYTCAQYYSMWTYDEHVPTTITRSWLNELVRFHNNCCYLCGTTLETPDLNLPSSVNWWGPGYDERHKRYQQHHVTSFDQSNPSDGYTAQNVRPCCHRCNLMKGPFNVHDFRKYIGKIVQHMDSWPPGFLESFPPCEGLSTSEAAKNAKRFTHLQWDAHTNWKGEYQSRKHLLELAGHQRRIIRELDTEFQRGIIYNLKKEIEDLLKTKDNVLNKLLSFDDCVVKPPKPKQNPTKFKRDKSRECYERSIMVMEDPYEVKKMDMILESCAKKSKLDLETPSARILEENNADKVDQLRILQEQLEKLNLSVTTENLKLEALRQQVAAEQMLLNSTQQKVAHVEELARVQNLNALHVEVDEMRKRRSELVTRQRPLSTARARALKKQRAEEDVIDLGEAKMDPITAYTHVDAMQKLRSELVTRQRPLSTARARALKKQRAEEDVIDLGEAKMDPITAYKQVDTIPRLPI